MKKRTQRTETLFTFYGISIPPKLCNCKGIYAPIVSLFYLICELWRESRLRGIQLLNQDIVQAQRERIRDHAVIFALCNSPIQRERCRTWLRSILAHQGNMRCQ